MSGNKGKEKKNSSLLSTDTVAVYLREIGRVPLLEKSEEISYGKQVQRMMSCLEKKEKLEQESVRVISEKEWASAVGLSEAELKQVLAQGQQAKNKMIRANLRLVVAIAKKYLKRNLEFLDLIQEGSIGLERGVEKFDPSKGYKFSTYAYWWIRQGITRAIAQKSRTIRLPIHVTEKLNKIKKAQRELALRLGRLATTGEVAAELGLKSEEIREYIKIAQKPMSLEVRLGESQETELGEMIESKGLNPLDYAEGEWRKQAVRKMLSELKPKEREVIVLRFGLLDGQQLSLAEIGSRMNLSRERVRQIEHKALAHLRRQNALTGRDDLAS